MSYGCSLCKFHCITMFSWMVFWLQAEPQLINCRSGLIIKDLNLCFPQKVSSGSSNSFSYECVSFSKGDIGEFVHALHPDLKQSVVDCLRRNGLTFRVLGEETVSKHWYSQYLKSTPSSLNTHRRFLATQSPAAAPGPAVSSGPDTSSSPSPSGTLDSGSSPPAPPPKVSFFPPFNAPSPQALLSQSNSSASLSSNDQASKENSSKRAVVIAVAVTAPITFLLAALLFLCYNKYRSRIRAGRNDDRPLLSMSDYSVGSSYKPYGLGSSIKEEKPKDNFPAKASAGGGTDGRIHTSTGGGMGDMGGGMHASLVWETFESPHANSGNGVFSPFRPLKPPPGRAAANSNFLKPPAGRADPLPPERPAPPKLPAKTGRRPPPPPSAPKPAPLSVVTKLPPGQSAAHSVSKPGGPPPAPSGLKPSGPPSQLPVPSGPKSGASPPPPSPAPSGSKPGAPPPPPPPAPSGPKPGAPPPRPPPAPSGPKLGAPPPPLPKSGPSVVQPPPHPPGAGPKINRPPPLAPKGPGGGVALDEEANAPKTKLKPFFWDKVLANPDQSMVWHHIKSGSFR
ncbi:hypothetical protein SAY86_015620 [Trapa natans]|uniref:FH2 domain-containing protein n=1 Tax=Trapa natans TaxID=22666 RepID=A0AAN7R0E4_TRANT|nr:hypothetical protein SAY86_015620 [Trapa natans]